VHNGGYATRPKPECHVGGEHGGQSRTTCA
jgi:hypothetical protein